jgi:translation initiation factor IF-2
VPATTGGGGPAPVPPTERDATSALATGFAATTGYGCPSTAAASFSETGRWTQSLDGFLQVASGGMQTPGCDGTFDAMPMSGSATAGDPGNYATWTFRTSPVTTGTCHLDVYVPDDTSLEHAGGDPAVYTVYDSDQATGTPAGTFSVHQPASLGQWVPSPAFAVTSGAMTVRLDSRGVDWTSSGPDHAHIAVSDVSISCAPAGS